MSAKDRQSYAEILNVIEARVKPSDAGLEVLIIQKTMKKETLLILKKGAMSRPLKRCLARWLTLFGLEKAPRNQGPRWDCEKGGTCCCALHCTRQAWLQRALLRKHSNLLTKTALVKRLTYKESLIFIFIALRMSVCYANLNNKLF